MAKASGFGNGVARGHDGPFGQRDSSHDHRIRPNPDVLFNHNVRQHSTPRGEVGHVRPWRECDDLRRRRKHLDRPTNPLQPECWHLDTTFRRNSAIQ